MKVSSIIRDSTSPWNSSIVIIPEKGTEGSFTTMFCSDCRELNKVTKGDAHPLPKLWKHLIT